MNDLVVFSALTRANFIILLLSTFARLWAFMAQVEACLDGDVPDGEDTAGAYALFAESDVPKAYDQVRRDGLYLALYSIGVRGPMWNRRSSRAGWMVPVHVMGCMRLVPPLLKA